MVGSPIKTPRWRASPHLRGWGCPWPPTMTKSGRRAKTFQGVRAPVTVVSLIYASTPLITLVLAHFFLRRLEPINPALVTGTMLSLGGVVMVILGASAA